MNGRRLACLAFTAMLVSNINAQREKGAGVGPVPKAWDEEAIATLEIPLANPIGSPKHVSAEYYYRIPVAPIYRSYPVYAPAHEPPGYLDWLKQQEPEIIWDGNGRAPSLRTEADWITAGEIVFDAPVRPAIMSVDDVQNAAWYEERLRMSFDDGWPITKCFKIKKASNVGA